MAKNFDTTRGLELYSDGVLETSFTGLYFAFYQPEYDNLCIRSIDGVAIYREENASSITLDGVAFINIQDQLNEIFESLRIGSVATNAATEITLVGLVNLLTGLGKYFGPVVIPSRGTLSITAVSQVVIPTVGSKSGTLRNATNGTIYVSFGATATINSALALIPDAYYEIPTCFIGLSCNVIGTATYTGVLSYTNNEG